MGGLERVYHNRNQDTKGSPGGSGGKSQEASNQENNSRKQSNHTLRAALNQISHELRGAQAVCHGLQGPGEGQNHDGRNHGLEALGNAVHALLEAQDLTAHIQQNRDDQGESTSNGQTDGRVAVGEGGHEVRAVKEAAGVNHADDTADDQGKNRNQQILYGTISHVIQAFCVAVRSVRRSKQVALLCVVLMDLHGTEINVQNCYRNHHNDSQNRVEIIGNRADKESQSVLTLYETGYSRRPG